MDSLKLTGGEDVEDRPVTGGKTGYSSNHGPFTGGRRRKSRGGSHLMPSPFAGGRKSRGRKSRGRKSRGRKSRGGNHLMPSPFTGGRRSRKSHRSKK